MPEQLIVEATPYTPLPKPHERRFEVAAYGWQSPKKREPLRVKEQLPQQDWDELYALWEGTDKMLADQRYPNQEGFKNVQRQMGNWMMSKDLIRKVIKLNPSLVSQESNSVKGNAAFYYVNADKTLKYTNAHHELGVVPEFTIMKTDAADLPSYYPRMGWRAVLVRLLKGRYLSWNQVLSTFGDVPHLDDRGLHWWLNVKHFKG